ncbi:beta-propeller fold lactonase family protein [Terriglobus roseus]|uniref:Lactonase, 7-bladed beta-propeller n=1 Tax=Terriglobus roseus TaxID=392734 RepID=A0A1H4IY11_9BACT|nr:beta-propeller fold lactonase family protein [Terriglobus roseus]SEB38984.1 Lactonase, 7-bladed beta-propeller [Terriglobus roseus]
MQQSWTRRHFLGAASLTMAAHGIRFAKALPPHEGATHAYVTVQDRDGHDGIQVLRSADGVWQKTHFIETFAPSAILLSAGEDLLFVANARNRFEGLPTASIESYRIDPHSRILTRIATRKLGLASVMPHAMALSPDGSLLVVAAAAGVYNILPVSLEGIPGEVTAVRKELRLNSESPTRMNFVSKNKLKVQDQHGTRLYHCDRDGMSQLQALPSSTQQQKPGPPLLVPGQRSVVFARFA